MAPATANPSGGRRPSVKAYLADLLRVQPSNFDHHPAIRCAIGVAIPLVALAAAGHAELIPFGSFGALIGVFGRGEPHRMRLRSQIMAAVLILSAVALGLSLGAEGAPWQVVVAGATATAFAGAFLSGAARLKPAGSMFFVLAYAATVLIGSPTPALAFGVAVASALISLGVGTAGWVLPGHRTPWETKSISWPKGREWMAVAADGLTHGVAVAIAGSLAALIGLTHINWAMLTATVPLVGVSTGHRLNRGVQRVIGTVGGLAIAALIFALNPPTEVKIAALIALQFLIELYVTRNYALGQVFATPYSLVLIEVSHKLSPWELVGERGVETVLGALVGVGMVVLGNQFHGKIPLRKKS